MILYMAGFAIGRSGVNGRNGKDMLSKRESEPLSQRVPRSAWILAFAARMILKWNQK
jgi:hypothetical protein